MDDKKNLKKNQDNQASQDEDVKSVDQPTEEVNEKLTDDQIEKDTEMAPVDEDLKEEPNETKNAPTELTKEQVEEDQQAAEVSDDLKEEPTEKKEAPDKSADAAQVDKPTKLTKEQIEEDQQTAEVSADLQKKPTEAVAKSEDAMQDGKPAKLTKEQIKEDSEMAPVEDPDEKLAEAKKQLAKNDPNDPAKWFIVHTYSGHENKVAKSIQQRVQSLGFENRIFDIIVPTRNTIKVNQGKKENVKEKIFPGYVLVKMVLDDESWLLIRTTQGVTAFIGAGNKPTPISAQEVAAIMKFMDEEEPMYKTSFTIGEAVKIVDGPFADFLGTIDNIDEEKGKLKVLVSIFGRETPVELDFLQVNKL